MHSVITQPPWEERAVNSKPVPTQPTENNTPFIEANTSPATLRQIEQEHIIPVFAKDNEPLIDQASFIGLVMRQVQKGYSGEPSTGDADSWFLR